MREYLRASQAAEFLGVATQTLARWRVEGGKVPFVRLGRVVVYDVRDLRAFADSSKRLSTAEPVRSVSALSTG